MDEQPESDIRRRAAYLLGMLVVVAALLIVLMVTFFNTSGGDPDGPDQIAGPSETVAPASSGPSASPSPTRSESSSGSSSQSSQSQSSQSQSSSPSSGSSDAPGSAPPTGGSRTCPPDAPAGRPCALDTDVGNALDAINDYRAANDKARVPGSISAKAQQCAVDNGRGCDGGWAETQVSKPDGTVAVKQIRPFGKLLSDMKRIELGWAYDPKAKQYYFAIIRQD